MIISKTIDKLELHNCRGFGGRGRHGGHTDHGRSGGRGGRGGEGAKGYAGHGQWRHTYNQGNKNSQEDQAKGIFIPDEVLQAVPWKFHAMLRKGRDQMENENGNIHASRKINDNTYKKTSRIEILDVKDEQVQKDDSKNEYDERGASSKFGATEWNNRKAPVGAIISSIRRTAHLNSQTQKQRDCNLRARAEIDTCANTLFAGSLFIVFQATGKVVAVSGFHDSYKAIKNIPVGTCITAIDLEDETIIASFPQSLYFGDSMKTFLIPPAQLWDLGITVDVVPKQ